TNEVIEQVRKEGKPRRVIERLKEKAEETLAVELQTVSAKTTIPRVPDEGKERRALDDLRAQMPVPGQKDLRGFAWYYFWRNSPRDLATLEGPGKVVAFSPDGKTLATGGFHQTGMRWDAGPGRKRST